MTCVITSAATTDGRRTATETTGRRPLRQPSYALSSLLNLTASFGLERDRSQLLMKGTVEDLNFAECRLEYAPVSAALQWSPIGAASDTATIETVAITILNVGQAPVCTLAAPSAAVLWPPDHKLVPVSITGLNDPNAATVRVAITGVTQDEPVNGQGDGDTSPDAVIQGETVLLRAERSGSGDGRLYRISFTATAPSGASCAGSVAVGVPDNKKPGRPIIDDGQHYDSTKK